MCALMTDLAINAGMLPAPNKPSFREDILPILKAMTDLQWMNAGFAAGFGYGSASDFLNEEYLNKLATPGDTYSGLRRTVANAFRNPEDNDISMKPWPWVYGDAMDVPMPAVANAMNALTKTQLALLNQWADGHLLPTSLVMPSRRNQLMNYRLPNSPPCSTAPHWNFV